MNEIERYEHDRYSIAEVNETEKSYYQQLLIKTYAPLGFLKENIFPKQHSRCFLIKFNDEPCGTFALTPLATSDERYKDLIPDWPKANHPRLLELTNVILQPEVRGSIALGVLLYEAAKQAHRDGFTYLVGITRSKTLRYFVDFGVTPIYHEPMHVLGKKDILDFAIYYRTDEPKSVFYMHERAQRFFHQESVMAKIRATYLNTKSKPVDLAYHVG